MNLTFSRCTIIITAGRFYIKIVRALTSVACVCALISCKWNLRFLHDPEVKFGYYPLLMGEEETCPGLTAEGRDPPRFGSITSRWPLGSSPGAPDGLGVHM